MKRHITDDWLTEADIPPLGGQPDPGAIGPPMTDPNMGMGNPANPMGDPNVTNMPNMANTEMDADPEDDVTQDPETPDMPEEKKKIDDFEVWKNNYFKESITGDANKLLDLLGEVRGAKLLSYQKKFVEDNWNIQICRQNTNIAKASKEIRRLIKEQLDQNNPATSVVNHMVSVLETDPMLNNIFLKLNGYGALKGDLHRKFVAALLGAVQVSVGASEPDIIFNDRDYSIMISTRFNAKWGDVLLGTWSLKEDDPETYLSEPEMKRLQDGSPEEKDVLRRRVVMESISKQFDTRAFIIHVADDDGTIHTLGWDISNALKSAYSEGKMIVKVRHSDNSEAMIDDHGRIVPLVDLSINFSKETGEQDEDGLPEREEIEFMERKNGMLFLSASLNTIRDTASQMQGTVYKEIPYNGNPNDVEALAKCVYSTHDMLMRQC